jgi:hypothetical protein
VFGVSLASLVQQERSAGAGGCVDDVPDLVRRCVDEVERRGGVEQVGIYRLCGSAKRAQRLRDELDERGVRNVNLSSSAVGDINVITVLLKDYLRDLPDPVCTSSLYQMLMDALSVQVPNDHLGNAQLMLSILDCLPKVNQDTLCFLLDHLQRICLKSNTNQMTSSSLAAIFGPILVCPSPQADQDRRLALNFDHQVQLVKYLLDIWPRNRDINQPLARLAEFNDNLLAVANDVTDSVA